MNTINFNEEHNLILNSSKKKSDEKANTSIPKSKHQSKNIFDNSDDELNNLEFRYFYLKDVNKGNQTKNLQNSMVKKYRVYIAPHFSDDEQWNYHDFLNTIYSCTKDVNIKTIQIPYYTETGYFTNFFFISVINEKEIENKKSFTSTKTNKNYIIGDYNYSYDEAKRKKIGNNFDQNQKRYWLDGRTDIDYISFFRHFMSTNFTNIIEFVEIEFGKDSFRESKPVYYFFNFKHCRSLHWDRSNLAHTFPYQGRTLYFKPNANPKE